MSYTLRALRREKQSDSTDIGQAEGNKGKGRMTFLQISTAARLSERQCDFSLAVALWSEAHERAHKEVNKEWAQKRSELCQMMISYQASPVRRKLPECCIRHLHETIHY